MKTWMNFCVRRKMHVLDAKDSFLFTIFQVPSPQQEGPNGSQYNGLKMLLTQRSVLFCKKS